MSSAPQPAHNPETETPETEAPETEAPETETPDAPEPEGLRAKKLREVFNLALSKSINTCSYENFSACFPTPARHVEPQLKNVWEQMRAFFEGNAKKEYETILKERNVVSNLNQLDVLIKEAEARKAAAKPGEKPISPSMLPPAAILAAHFKPKLHEAQKNLNARITAIQTNNSELMQTIVKQRNEMEELMKTLERNVDYLEETVVNVNTAVNGARLVEGIKSLEED